MKLFIKHFNELSCEELFDIYKARVEVFVVEQQCPYQEVDDADKVAYHIWLQDEDGIQAYARALPAGATFKEASVGRVISKKRHCGLATKVVSAAVQVVREKFHENTIRIEAQEYAKSLYEKVGFVQISEPFIEDGIPHVLMEIQGEKGNGL